MEQGHERRYAIRPNDAYGFHTGFTPNNEQVLMGLSCPKLVAFHFDLEGKLLRSSCRPVPFFQGVTPPYRIYDVRLPPLIEAWQKDMGLRLATIKVKKFFSHEYYIGIEDYPSHFQDVLSDPSSDDEKADVLESMETWGKDGQFVLQWGNDYWLDESGGVVSS